MLAQLSLDRGVRMFLQIAVKRGAHGQHAIVAEFFLVGEFFDLVIGVIEIPVRGEVAAAIDRGRGIAQRRVDLTLGQVAGLDHIVQDIVRARAGGGQIDMGRIFRWRLEQAGNHGGFGEREIAHGFAEVEFRRGLHAESAAPEIGTIEIEPQNLASWEDGTRARWRDRPP